MTSLLLMLAAIYASGEPSGNTVELYQPFTIEYTAAIPDDASIDPLFYQELKNKAPYCAFAVQSMHISPTSSKGERRLTFELIPKAAGKQLFFPGVASLGHSVDIIFNPVAVDVRKPESLASFIEPLLPLNPDQHMSLSEQNRQRSFQEAMHHEKLREEHLFASRVEFMTFLSTFAMAAAAAALLFWIGYEQEKGKSKKRIEPKPIDWDAELQKLLRDTSSPLEERFNKLAHILVKVSFADSVKEIAENLTCLRFSGRPLSQTEWASMIVHVEKSVRKQA